MKTKTLRYVLAAGLAALGSTVVADPALAWDTAACDPKGVTAADADLATALNSRLTANLRNALTGYRISCARMIVKTVRAGGWDPHAATIAVTTAIVETTLMNISEKVDHTSLGLFQQQDWWGSAKDRMNPVWTTNKFLSAMAAKHPDGKWLTDPIGKVCQEVQGSAYPTRYGENAADGKTVAEALWGIDDPVEKPDPHGTVYARSRSAGGTWQNSATRIDTNTAISGIAATRQQTDNSLHVFTVVPGSGIWHRKAWEADATRIDSNPEVNDVAAAGLPNGTLHVFANVPGSGVWHRIRQTNGTWTDATRVDTNGGIYDIAATGLPDGTVHLQTLVSGTGVYDRARSAAGSWAAGATRIDTNDSINAIASAALPDGSLHILTAVPGNGVWHRKAWEANATRIDTNASVTAISAAGLADGTLQLDVAVEGSGVWHRSRTTAGTWGGSAVQVDGNGRIFSTYTVGLGDNSVHVGTNVDLS